MSSTLNDGSYRINIHNGLLLYYNRYSFYSQKVLMSLYEKNLPFESHLINLSKSIQYEPWFLQLNPRGEVPVLQDGNKIIPDSHTIIDYLEDHFRDERVPRLIPMDQGPKVRQKVTYFRYLLEQFPSGIITVGSFHHQDLMDKPKLPFSPFLRHILLNPEKNNAENLKKHAEKNPNNNEKLLQKIELQKKKMEVITNRKEYEFQLDQIEDILDKVEEELASHNQNEENFWLCAKQFTIADINLALILERLYRLGLETRFWSGGKRPFIEKYYAKVKLRESFKKSIPDMKYHIKMLINNANKTFTIGVTVAAAIALTIGGYFVAKSMIR